MVPFLSALTMLQTCGHCGPDPKSAEVYEKIPIDFNGLWIGPSEIAMAGPEL